MSRKPEISEMKTYAMVQTNAPKILYGSAMVGAGFKDKYQDFRRVRGRFRKKYGSSVLSAGTKLPADTFEYAFRYERAIMEVLDLQLRLIIHDKTYTLDSFDVEVHDNQEFFFFTLQQYGK